MFPLPIPNKDPDEFCRCEERKQINGHEKILDPIQKADAVIKDSLYRAFSKDDVLRAMEYDEIDVHMKNGVVHLSGHIVSVTNLKRIENAIRSIPNIVTIKNDLVLDDKLTLEVAASLGLLESLYGCTFFTGVSHGVVSLNGIVTNEEIKLLAEMVAANNPRVRAVINKVRLTGERLVIQDRPFLQPVIGELIYFLDGVRGVVKQVIINPNNRCVVAMVIQGKFTDPRYDLGLSTYGGEARLPEQLVTVSMDLVRYLTRVSGFLYIQSSERDKYLDFDPGVFAAPHKDWTPPYPYCPADVLFPVDQWHEDVQITDQSQLFPIRAILEDSSVRI